MTCTKCLMFGAAALIAVGGTITFAQSSMTDKTKDKKPAAAAQKAMDDHGGMQLPPGWTPEDMAKCMAAGTPGEMQAHLTADAGVWNGTSKMWMGPDTEPQTSDVTTTVTPMYDGRYVKVEVEGDMGGMPFQGFGIYGYDNVAEKFQATWIDNMGTGLMFGVGNLSSDGDTMTWTYAYTCPINEKPTTMREVDTRTGPNTKTFQIFANDPHSGKEYKMMEVNYTRTKGGDAHAMVSPGMFSNKDAEAGCGFCSYHMDGVKSCTPAVKIDGKAYIVTGADDVNFHQFCGAKGPKPAVVSGKIVDGKLVATNVEVKN